MKTLFRFIFMLMAFSTFANASQDEIPKSVLVLIGYADEHLGPLDLISYRHPAIARQTENEVRRKLVEWGARPNGPEHFLTVSGLTSIHVLNSFTLCPGENWKSLDSVASACPAQLAKSKQIMDYLESSVGLYETIIYIGHAREGLGLGIGPFIDAYTWKPAFFNEIELGRIRKVIISACNSEKYYRKNFRRNVEFDGLHGDQDWLNEMVPFALKHLEATLK